MSDHAKGVMMAAGTGLLWGASGPIARIISDAGVTMFTLTSLRAVIIAVVVGAYLVASRGASSLAISGKLLKIYFLIAIFAVVCNGTGYFMSYAYLTVPQAITLHYTFPLVTMIAECILLREKFSWSQAIGCGLVLLGLYVAFIWGGGVGEVSIIGACWGLTAIFGFTAQNILTRKTLKRGESDPIVQLFWSNVIGGAMLIIGTSAFVGWDDTANITPAIVPYMAYPIIINGLVGFGLLYASMKYIPATLASLLCTIELVSSLALMPLILGSSPSMHEAIGAALIFVAVAVSTIGKLPRAGAASRSE